MPVPPPDPTAEQGPGSGPPQVPGSAQPFRPSTNGFAFANSWPDEPAVTVPTPFGSIPVGNAAAGLCGGMAFAALDYWHAGLPTPTTQPTPADPLYGYIVSRLVASWNVPAGVAQYYQWMNLPDLDRVFSVLGRTVVTERGLWWRTVQGQWPQVRSDLDAGIPVPLGIVTVASANPADLGLNHQVAAWSYTVDGPAVTVAVYDPNQPGDDNAGVTFDAAAAPTSGPAFTHSLGIGHGVRGFFRTAYAPAQPPTK